ncbi:MAG: radical SAM protein [Actinobacteria bacterium]|nr:radical SAM protein [Actinomycetota bacterium]
MLDKYLEKCVLCPHKCRINRNAEETGFCNAGLITKVSSAMVHHGEEPPISGDFGSGTIFFSHCNMRCVYCQNYQISQKPGGTDTNILKLAEIMIELQAKKCHNINLVSPTIWIPQILSAVSAARKKGLSIPLVYNTGGYDNPKIIKSLKGTIDIYMPDMRYSSDLPAEKYSGIKNYVKNNRESVVEMYRQVGNLKIDRNGVANKGLLIRLLVMPDNISGTRETLDFIKSELSVEVPLSIMAQYHPEYKASNFPELSRRINEDEYREVVNYAEKLGFENGWIQDFISLSKEDLFIPDFNREKVFKYYEK